MNIKKAAVQSVILYAIVFLVASALLSSNGQAIFTALVFIASAVTNYLLSKEYYFKGVNVAKPLKEGLMLGIVINIVMIAIDIPVMVYGFASSLGWNYILSWTMGVGYLINLSIPLLVAYTKK